MLISGQHVGFVIMSERFDEGAPMEKLVQEFLKRANECLAMAAKTGDGERKAELEKLAMGWHELAAERARFLDRISQSQKG